MFLTTQKEGGGGGGGGGRGGRGREEEEEEEAAQEEEEEEEEEEKIGHRHRQKNIYVQVFLFKTTTHQHRLVGNKKFSLRGAPHMCISCFMLCHSERLSMSVWL